MLNSEYDGMGPIRVACETYALERSKEQRAFESSGPQLLASSGRERKPLDLVMSLDGLFRAVAWV